jgi:hypothetical protein
LSGIDIGVIVNNLVYKYGLVIVKLPFNLDFNKYHNQINLKNKINIINHVVYTPSNKISYILSFVKL